VEVIDFRTMTHASRWRWIIEHASSIPDMSYAYVIRVHFQTGVVRDLLSLGGYEPGIPTRGRVGDFTIVGENSVVIRDGHVTTMINIGTAYLQGHYHKPQPFEGKT